MSMGVSMMSDIQSGLAAASGAFRATASLTDRNLSLARLDALALRQSDTVEDTPGASELAVACWSPQSSPQKIVDAVSQG